MELGDDVEVSGARLRVERHGHGGPRIVLVGEVGYDARLWRPQVEHLADTHRIVTIDLRSHGGSPQTAESEIPAAADILEVLDVLELDGAVLGALGETAGAALEVAAPASERFGGLLLCQPVLRGMPIPADFDPALVAAEAESRYAAALAAIERNDVDALADALLADPVNRLPGRPNLQRLVDAMVRDNAQLLMKPGGVPRITPLETKPVAERLDRIECPVTVAVRAPTTSLERAVISHLRDGLPEEPKVVELDVDPDVSLLPLVEPETISSLLAELAAEHWAI